MTIRLEDIAADLCRGTVTIRGKVYPARAVSSGEAGRVLKFKPRPSPPLKPVRGRDGRPDLDAAPFPDDRDPLYRLAFEDWAAFVKSVEVAIALDASVGGVQYAPDMDDAAFVAWMAAAAAVFAAKWSRDELNDAHDAVSSLHDISSLTDAARPN